MRAIQLLMADYNICYEICEMKLKEFRQLAFVSGRSGQDSHPHFPLSFLPAAGLSLP